MVGTLVMAPKSVTFRRHDHLVSVLFGDLLSHSYNITFSMFLYLVVKKCEQKFTPASSRVFSPDDTEDNKKDYQYFCQSSDHTHKDQCPLWNLTGLYIVTFWRGVTACKKLYR